MSDKLDVVDSKEEIDTNEGKKDEDEVSLLETYSNKLKEELNELGSVDNYVEELREEETPVSVDLVTVLSYLNDSMFVLTGLYDLEVEKMVLDTIKLGYDSKYFNGANKISTRDRERIIKDKRLRLLSNVIMNLTRRIVGLYIKALAKSLEVPIFVGDNIVDKIVKIPKKLLNIHTVQLYAVVSCCIILKAAKIDEEMRLRLRFSYFLAQNNSYGAHAAKLELNILEFLEWKVFPSYMGLG